MGRRPWHLRIARAIANYTLQCIAVIMRSIFSQIFTRYGEGTPNCEAWKIVKPFALVLMSYMCILAWFISERDIFNEPISYQIKIFGYKGQIINGCQLIGNLRGNIRGFNGAQYWPNHILPIVLGLFDGYTMKPAVVVLSNRGDDIAGSIECTENFLIYSSTWRFGLLVCIHLQAFWQYTPPDPS